MSKNIQLSVFLDTIHLLFHPLFSLTVKFLLIHLYWLKHLIFEMWSCFASVCDRYTMHNITNLIMLLNELCLKDLSDFSLLRKKTRFNCSFHNKKKLSVQYVKTLLSWASHHTLPPCRRGDISNSNTVRAPSAVLDINSPDGSFRTSPAYIHCNIKLIYRMPNVMKRQQLSYKEK